VRKSLLKRMVKLLAPRWLMDKYYQISGKAIRFLGTYPDWQAAKHAASGYDAVEILQQTIEKTQLVLSGKAAFERDAVAFDEPSYPYPLLALLLRAAIENDNKLNILDFGGSLGSSYYQCRSFLRRVSDLKWCVVEQRHFVDAGNTLFATDVLSFHNSIAEVKHPPNVVLFSSVLQYLPEPYAILEQAIGSQPDYILIDRTPFVDEGDSVLSLQKVPKNIVEACYAVWLFNERKFKEIFRQRYAEIATFDAIDGTIGYGRLKANFKGIMLKRIDDKKLGRQL